ncbi:hypothetical protein ACHAXS_000519 [Conticribra weissflogii]
MAELRISKAENFDQANLQPCSPFSSSDTSAHNTLSERSEKKVKVSITVLSMSGLHAEEIKPNLKKSSTIRGSSPLRSKSPMRKMSPMRRKSQQSNNISSGDSSERSSLTMGESVILEDGTMKPPSTIVVASTRSNIICSRKEIMTRVPSLPLDLSTSKKLIMLFIGLNKVKMI